RLEAGAPVVANPENSQLSSGDPLRCGGRGVCFCERPACAGEQCRACLGQFHLAAVAREQASAELLFELTDGDAERWLRHVQALGGAAEVELLSHADNGVVAVDSLLTVTESRAMRAALERIGKPLLAVLLTHSHSDYYGGLTELVAAKGVPIVARRT